MGRGVISFEKGKVAEKDLFLFVFRDHIGRTLFSGRLDLIQTKMRRIAEKAIKNQLKVRLLSVKTDPITKKFKIEDIVISFSRNDELAKFESELE